MGFIKSKKLRILIYIVIITCVCAFAGALLFARGDKAEEEEIITITSGTGRQVLLLTTLSPT